MHNVYSAHIFIVCNSVICTKSFNILAIFYNGHIASNCTGHFVYSPLNLYFIYIGCWTLNIYYYYYITLPFYIIHVLNYTKDVYITN